LFGRKETTARPIHVAYRQYEYRLAEIADLLGVHGQLATKTGRAAEYMIARPDTISFLSWY
jgi:hypothetical protein